MTMSSTLASAEVVDFVVERDNLRRFKLVRSDLPGAPPTFFFAPTQLQKRTSKILGWSCL